MAAVNLIRGLKTKQLRHGVYTLLKQIEACHRIARRHQANDVGHRSAVDQRAAECFSKTHHVADPSRDLTIDSGRISAAKVRPLDRSEKVGQRAGEVPRPHVSYPEPGMSAAYGVRHQIGRYSGINRCKRLSPLRQRGGKNVTHARGHFLPERAVADPDVLSPAPLTNQPGLGFLT